MLSSNSKRGAVPVADSAARSSLRLRRAQLSAERRGKRRQQKPELAAVTFATAAAGEGVGCALGVGS